ncbi:STAS domain-containing protein, partial [Teichococcus wenyumeiae]
MSDDAEAPGFARDGNRLALHGALTTERIGDLWNPLLKAARGVAVVDLSRVSALDTSGAALVLAAGGEAARLEGAGQGVSAVLERARDALAAPRPRP